MKAPASAAAAAAAAAVRPRCLLLPEAPILAYVFVFNGCGECDARVHMPPGQGMSEGVWHLRMRFCSRHCSGESEMIMEVLIESNSARVTTNVH